MAKKLIALMLAVMLVFSLMSLVYAVEKPGAATAADTITVYFEDSLSWGNINVYYWPNGGDWPGKPATLTTEKYETPIRGTKSATDVYSAQIPADVEGIIFNGNGNRTVDITEDIADGAKWAPTGEKDGNNFKVKMVEANQPTETPTEEPEILYGDVDGDGEITVLDATDLQRYLNMAVELGNVFEACDVDNDGYVTIMDATVIQRYLAKMPLPSGSRIGLQ